MSSKYYRRKKKTVPMTTLILLVLVVCLVLILGTVLVFSYLADSGHGNGLHLPFGTEPVTEAPTEPATEAPTEPLTPVTIASGKASEVQCKQTYTAEYTPALAAQTAAACAGAQLSNAELQFWYLSEVSEYRTSGNPIAPDYDLPLDCQICPLMENGMSWQHYFLERAVKSWQANQAMLNASRQPQPVQEEAYKPNEFDDLHGKYIAPELPVNNFLYSDQPCYKPNEMHQAYLDGLEEQMETLAWAWGYVNLEDYAQQTFGGALTGQELVSAARDYNTGYFYFTERSYNVDLTDEQIEQYWKAHKDELTDDDSLVVDMRHILLIPQDAEVDEDGRCVADAAQWDRCYAEAVLLRDSWRIDYQTTRNAESNFARLANQSSMDGGSKINGGYYQGIHRGDMIGALDKWLFDKDREEGDVGIVRSELGYHLVYLCRSYHDGLTAARKALTRQWEQKVWQGFLTEAAPSADYSAMAIWTDCRGDAITLADTLYPDVAHERFPEAIVYLQQDYMYHRYGGSYVGRGGCGITTFAMLTTYMTDEIRTPAMLADLYPYYHDENGTNGDIFRYATADMGYYMERSTSNIEEIIEALKRGQRVISLQNLGVFTSGGHYLLLQQYYEDSDTFQVRDSNIYNYGKLKGHQVDYFTRADILSGNSIFYIMQPKILRIPACSRCGTDMGQSAPELLLNGAYLCEKCEKALSRRENFLQLQGSL